MTRLDGELVFGWLRCVRAAWVLKKVRKGRQGGHLPLPYTFGQLSVRTRAAEPATDWAARCDPPLYIVAQILSFSISRSQPRALLLLNFLLWVKDMQHNTTLARSLKQRRRVNLPMCIMRMWVAAVCFMQAAIRVCSHRQLAIRIGATWNLTTSNRDRVFCFNIDLGMFFLCCC